MAPAASLRSAVALLGRFPALAGVDLDVEEGTVMAALGPNGAGKTTLLQVLAGLLELREGTGTVLGFDLANQRSALRRHVGLLGHETSLYPDLSARENLSFALRATRQSPDDATASLSRVGLAGRLADVPVRVLSAGQQRRMGLAWLHARRPRLWLLDEPHAGLDAEARELCDELIDGAARGGATVVFTSHDARDAAARADAVVTLRGGTVESVCPGGRQRRVA